MTSPFNWGLPSECDSDCDCEERDTKEEARDRIKEIEASFKVKTYVVHSVEEDGDDNDDTDTSPFDALRDLTTIAVWEDFLETAFDQFCTRFFKNKDHGLAAEWFQSTYDHTLVLFVKSSRKTLLWTDGREFSNDTEENVVDYPEDVDIDAKARVRLAEVIRYLDVQCERDPCLFTITSIFDFF